MPPLVGAASIEKPELTGLSTGCATVSLVPLRALGQTALALLQCKLMSVSAGLCTMLLRGPGLLHALPGALPPLLS